MRSLLRRYTRWLHTGWPAGTVEKLPAVGVNGETNVPGLYVVGDLTGIPLLKLSSHSGARAVRAIVEDRGFMEQRGAKDAGTRDLVIVGAGVSGMAAALVALGTDLDFVVYESNRPFQTIADFPARKPIFTYPSEMTPDGELQFTTDVKEDLLDEMQLRTAGVEVETVRVERVERRGREFEVTLADGAAVRALRVIVGIGRSGDFRKLGVSGEDLDKVHHRLHDPKDYAGRQVLVVGGGDSAVETAVALAQAGAAVTLSYRGRELTRPKPDNIDRLTATSAVALELSSNLAEIRPDRVVLEREGQSFELPNDVVFAMTGRAAPLEFFRRAGVRLLGETRGLEWLWVAGFFLMIFLLYDWKSDGLLLQWLVGARDGSAFPGNVPELIASLGGWFRGQVEDRSTLLGTLAVSMQGRSFYYTLLYTICVGAFGWARVRRRRTPYVTLQTTALFLIQLFPLFLLPELLLPWLGYNGVFDGGFGGGMADALFEKYIPDEQYLAGSWPDWGHPRAYWRAYGLILAWPLMVYNVFTHEPLGAWLAISVLQTFVLIPLLIWRFGKGAYCGWICSCGGLAETMGDTLRQRMPHGQVWNRLNMVGQALLLIAFLLLLMRIGGWLWPETWMNHSFALLLDGKNADGATVNPLSWKWTVDVVIGGVLGVGLYVKYSGRVWCRFACPLAALMHVYTRFSRFRILPDKKKCISCNVCTAVCHQGIDVMSFANKGLPMADPQCVRCSACVQSCPTGVLRFGRVDRSGRPLAYDRLSASPVRARESSSL